LISITGCWLIDDPYTTEHVFDCNLAYTLVDIFLGHTVLDLGCGFGHYVSYLRGNGIACDGFDGNPFTAKMTRNMCSVADLSQSFSFGKAYDGVLSLEVGEHIPAQFEKTFVDNLVRCNPKTLVLSWGYPGQPGFGHVNGKTETDVISLMLGRGFVYDAPMSQQLRQLSTFSWFKNTLFVFRKAA
jgi:SAM-dependent methyltransferase